MIDISRNINLAQIAFGIMIIAVSVFYYVFVREPLNTRMEKGKEEKKD